MGTKKYNFQINFEKVIDFKNINVNKIVDCFYENKIIDKNIFFELSIIDSDKMKTLNKKYAKTNKDTDVLSFPFDNVKYNDNTYHIGEIFISLPYVYNECKRLNITVEEEIVLLIIHGLLHLIGYDHENPTKKNLMFSIQEKIYKQYFK